MAEILLLGSDKAQTARVGSLLRLDGHIVHVLKDVERWRDAESVRDLDLIVAANRPSERIFGAGTRRARGFPTPILIVQQDPDLPQSTGREERLVDLLAAPFEPEEFLARVDALIRVRRSVRTLWAESGGDAAAPRVAPEGFLRRFGSGLASILGTRIPPYAKPRAPYVDVAARVADWADRRDAFEPGHAERVATFSALIAGGIGLPDNEAAATLRAALLHDIGKVALPIEILRQRGPLAEEQKRLLRTHPERGAAILDALHTDEAIVDAIRYHHERVDGQGYYRKSGQDLPMPARILAVAEVYDAMTSSTLAPALEKGAALRKMRELRGGQFDPDCVDALLEALKPRPARTQVARRRA